MPPKDRAPLYILFLVLFYRAALVVREDELPRVLDIAGNIHPARIRAMLTQGRYIWDNYFSSMRAITLTTLQILNDRVFPYAARKYEEWNNPPNAVSVHCGTIRLMLAVFIV